MIWYRILTLEMRLKEIVCNSKSQPVEANGFSKADKQKLDDGARPGRKSRSSSDTAAKAWVFSEACTGTLRNLKPSIRCKIQFNRRWYTF